MAGAVRIGKLVVIGVGLIGGSFALALKQAGAVDRIVGVGRTRANLDAALELGVIDEAASDPAAAVAGADLVLLAMPVGQMPEVMRGIAPHLAPGTVVTDAGSTKRDVIAYARRYLRRSLTRFVPAHPISGTEKSGATAAFPDLYRGRTVVLAPLPATQARAVRLVRAAWQTCGARIVRLPAREHDAIFAAVSHLPHVVAYALVNALARRRNARELFGFSAGGLRDTVRIAGSSPEMWADICMANRDLLLACMRDYQRELETMRSAIARGDAQGVRRMFVDARTARQRWLVRKAG